MTTETIVAVYDTAEHAEMAVQDLLAAKVPSDAISRHASIGMTMGAATTTTAPAQEKGFWARTFGGEPDHDTSVYDRSVGSGSTVVTVQVPDEHVTAVTEILEKHSPIDIDERASSYGIAQTTATQMPVAASGSVAAAPTDGVMQLSEEQLVVGTRVVNRGSTRIRRFVVETPVEQQVTLHEETVKIDRRPVTDGRPVTGQAFADKTIEMTETGEEAVVGKTAHVYEEVGLHKESAERVETVKDTVRREDVKIEQVPGEAVSTRTTAPVTPTTKKI